MSETKAPPALPGEVYRWEHDGVTLAIDSDGRAWCWAWRDGEFSDREWNRSRACDTYTAQFLRERARADEAEQKAHDLARELQASLDKERNLSASLSLVHADAEGVWRWQGDGYDHPESLSCPVVMSADTLRALLARGVQP